MTTLYKAGELLILEDGEYSDKSWSGPFRVLKDFDIVDLAEQLKATFKPEEHHYSSEPEPYNFRDWLHTQGFIEDVECRSVHIGSYGRLEIER
jgi:hypothetical protein